MNKIETNTWNEYKIEDLFDIHPTNHYNMTNSNLFMKEGSIPVIVNSSYNNGVGGYVSLLPTEKGGIITFSDTTDANSIFYQPNDFIGYSHVQGMYPKFKNVTNNIMRFIATIFKIKALTMGYDYANKFRRDIAEKLKIKLPSKNGEPDWEYMESYMKNIMQESEKNIKNLYNIKNSKKKINLNNWKNFKIGGKNGLFEVTRPYARSAQTYNEGNMPYIASGCFNNGVCGYFEQKNKKDFDKGNCITVSPVDGYAFYQKKDFLGRGGAGSSIIILRRDNLNEYIGKFICTVIRNTCNDWSYSNMGNKDKLKNTIIKLPTTPNGEPDWKYMESYMKNIMQDTHLKLDKFVCY